MMKTLQLILLALTTLGGCSPKEPVGPVKITIPVKTTRRMSDTVSYLALGDSYTIGEAVPQEQSYPYQLVKALSADSLFVETPRIIAVTGWTTDNLIDAIASSGLQGRQYDFVTLLIGVNDQYQQKSIDNYKIKFTEVLNTAIGFAGNKPGHVFVLSIPDWGVTPFAQGRDSEIYPQILAFNAVNDSISKAAGVNYLNITDISRIAATDTSLLAADGLHPSGKMYALWVNKLAPLIAGQIKK